MTTLAQVSKLLDFSLASANAELAGFADTLAKDPHYAFRWAEAAMAAAAERQLTMELQGAIATMTERDLSEAQQLEHVQKELNRRVMHAARFPQRSTSVCSNEMSALDAQVAAKFLERMHWA